MFTYVSEPFADAARFLGVVLPLMLPVLLIVWLSSAAVFRCMIAHVTNGALRWWCVLVAGRMTRKLSVEYFVHAVGFGLLGLLVSVVYCHFLGVFDPR